MSVNEKEDDDQHKTIDLVCQFGLAKRQHFRLNAKFGLKNIVLF